MPAWEDVSNKDGGKWSVQLPKDKTRPRIDEMWLYTVRPPSPPCHSVTQLIGPFADARRHW